MATCVNALTHTIGPSIRSCNGVFHDLKKIWHFLLFLPLKSFYALRIQRRVYSATYQRNKLRTPANANFPDYSCNTKYPHPHVPVKRYANRLAGILARWKIMTNAIGHFLATYLFRLYALTRCSHMCQKMRICGMKRHFFGIIKSTTILATRENSQKWHRCKIWHFFS